MKLFEVAIDWNNVSEKEQIEWVKKKYMNIRKISNPSLKVQLAAVYPDGMRPGGPGGGWPCGLAMSYIKNPDKRLQMHIVKQNGRYLSDVMKGDPNISDDIIQAAAESDLWGVRNVIMFNQYHPSQEKIIEFLMNPKVIQQVRASYEDFLKQVYPDNELLQRKWLRYRDNKRGTL